MENKKQALMDILDQIESEGVGVTRELYGTNDPKRRERLVYQLFDKNLNKFAQDAGEIPFDMSDRAYQNIKTLVPEFTKLPENLQKRGLATRVYQDAEKLTGRKVVPDYTQSPEGFNFHQKHGFGKDFGMSEDELISKLTPTENLQRNARKKALSDAMDLTADRIEELELGNRKNLDFWEISENMEKNLEKSSISPRNVDDLLGHARREALDTGSNKSAIDWLRKNKGKYLKGVKSFAGAIPIFGTGLAAILSPEDASAAIPILDQAESVGETPEMENMLIAESQARKDYQQSPAARDAANYRKLQKTLAK